MEAARFIALLGEVLNFSTEEIYALVGVFTRIGAMAALLPGFGEQTLPTRIRLGAAVAFALIVWPLVRDDAVGAWSGSSIDSVSLTAVILAEAAAGLLIGLSIRLLVMALQLAGSIAAQATAVAQIFGAGVTPDPMPAIGNFLTVAGITLALVMGLHVKVTVVLMDSYSVIPFGGFSRPDDIAMWGVSRASAAFALAFSIAAPFVVASLLYNLALGAINRAMPQLMVALVGAPAITGLMLFLLWASAPIALAHWAGVLDRVLLDPFGDVE
ncbi:MAG: flagellar biosynthetic protein FliR [Pseudomonadota bacterium]